MRTAGILLPVSSLPSPYGIGTMGQAARDFIDFLQKAGQHYWQILPLGPTGYGNSPYQSFSAFALNPYLIDLDELIGEGLLSVEEVTAMDWGEETSHVDYQIIYRKRLPLLSRAMERYSPPMEDWSAFLVSNQDWLPNYALFMSIKEDLGDIGLQAWPRPLRLRETAALSPLSESLSDRVLFWQKLQFVAARQWQAVLRYAHACQIEIIGDLPLYLSADSSEVWTEPKLFQIDEDMQFTHVSGCPPVDAQDLGQLWGNPLYDWDYHKSSGWSWWQRRLSKAAEIYDVIRLDHFKGLDEYYSIPSSASDARTGEWIEGPGRDFFSALQNKMPALRLICEDLGYERAESRALLAYSAYPGMKILEYAFDPRGGADYLPHNYPRNCVVYPGTHDNPTLEEWSQNIDPATRAFAEEYLCVSRGQSLCRAIIKIALASVADLCVIQMQDYLALGKEGRMNTPGTTDHNWTWRVRGKEDLTEELAKELKRMAWLYGRIEGVQ